MRLRPVSGRLSAARLLLPAVLSLLVVSPSGAAAVSGPASTPAVLPQAYPGGGIYSFGNAEVGAPSPEDLGANGQLPAPVVAMVSDEQGTGYWLAGADGTVKAVGSATSFGTLAGQTLQAPIVGMTATSDDKGYWLAGMDGGIFAFGDATFYGSMGGAPLNTPVVGIAALPTGLGYYEVASDGGIFAFGNARFEGSMGGRPLVAPVTGIAAAPVGAGYWEVAADGGIFAFGSATFVGSMGGKALDDGIVSMAATPDGKGYWMVGWDGGVFNFGDAGFYGSPVDGPAVAPVTQIVPTPSGGGYWLVEPDGFPVSFAHPSDGGGGDGGAGGGAPEAAAIVAAASSQVGSDPDGGTFCNPYGPCEEWCSLFATWAFQRGGVPVPSYPFTGNFFDWAAQDTAVLPGTATPAPGDALFYGTGPATTRTSLHTGIVAQVWPDGAIDTVEGDAGPGKAGHLAVIINGPFLPSQSAMVNGFPIYGYAVP